MASGDFGKCSLSGKVRMVQSLLWVVTAVQVEAQDEAQDILFTRAGGSSLFLLQLSPRLLLSAHQELWPPQLRATALTQELCHKL